MYTFMIFIFEMWAICDLESTKSTSGLWLEPGSEDGKRCWPLSWRSKRQGSTASSTCEAEMISLATALKAEVLAGMLFAI